MTEQIPTPSASHPDVEPLSTEEERTWAMLAHLTVLINLFTGLLGPVAALIIYLVYRDRSRYVAYQSLQSVLMQVIAWLGGGLLAAILWVVAALLTIVCIGVLLYPVAMLVSLLPIAAVVYGIYAAIQCNEGRDFKYWQIGDWLRSTYTGEE